MEFTEEEIEEKVEKAVQDVAEHHSLDLHSVNVLEEAGNKVIDELTGGED